MKLESIFLVVALLLSVLVVAIIECESSDCADRGGVMVRTEFNGVRCIGGKP